MAGRDLARRDKAALAKASADGGAETQYITFEIGEDTYLVPISSVVEFRTWSEPTRVPHTPDFVRGIVNIRGEIVPIYDVGRRLGHGLTVTTPRHVVVIVRNEEGQSIGLLVDSVTDIITARAGETAALPRIEGGAATPFMSGVVFVDERILGVADIGRLVQETFSAGGFGGIEEDGEVA